MLARRNYIQFAAGVATGILLTLSWSAGFDYVKKRTAAKPRESDICYTCFWQGYDPKVRSGLVDYFRQYQNPDPLVMADVGYVMWRITSQPNCDLRNAYRQIGDEDTDPIRRYVAHSVLGFGAAECGERKEAAFRAAVADARAAGLTSEAKLLDQMAHGGLKPEFALTEIVTALNAPRNAKSLVLGESRIELALNSRIVTQVDRVTRDWLSNQMRWAPDQKAIDAALHYHEGAVVNAIVESGGAQVLVAAGTVIAKRDDKWYAADDEGRFRFQILPDKILYPTTHVDGDIGWIEDTHGISVLVPQAVERHAELVIGCGDAVGKAEAAFYLAQKGINVMFPGDRYEDLLLGYTGKGVLMGGAPVRRVDDKIVLGGQPVRIGLREPITVQDTKRLFPLQYYDSAARYFRKLATVVPLNLKYVEVENQDELFRVLNAADKAHSTVVAVRVMTEMEDEMLRSWLRVSPTRRAVLFHSGLYPYAQPLFHDYPKQVTFGDLRPLFE